MSADFDFRDGRTRFTRRTLPKALFDTASWPEADFSKLPDDEQARADTLCKAIKDYLAWKPLKDIQETWKVGRSCILRALNRCVAVGPLGTMLGWGALVLYKRVGRYKRRQDLPYGPHVTTGFQGAFQRFLDDHPDIRKAIEAAIIKEGRPNEPYEFRRVLIAVYTAFRQACRAAEISNHAYPLNTASKGLRSVARLLKVVLESNWSKGLRANLQFDAAHRLRVANGETAHRYAYAPFDIVQMDAHRINVVGTIRIPTLKGPKRVPIRRLVLIVLVDVFSHAILGYAIAYSREANAHDLILTIDSAMQVWRPRKLSIPGLEYPQSGGLPSGVIPEAAGAAFAMLQVDNALIHLGFTLIFDIRRRLGCAINLGAFGSWERRALVENTFKRLEARGFQRIVSSTDKDPISRGKVNPNLKAVEHEIDLAQLVDVIDVVIAGQNGSQDEGLAHMTPLAVLREGLAKASQFLVRHLPPAGTLQPEIGITIHHATVRGSLKQGRRPYVQLDRVHYTNRVLAQAPQMIGKRVMLHVDERDMRTVKAFLEDGSEIGVLTATGAWSRTPHSRVVRRMINAELKAKVLELNEEMDPVVALHELRARQAAEDAQRQSKRAPKMSDAATDLARIGAQTGLPIPQELPKFEPPPAPQSPKLPIDKMKDLVNRMSARKGSE